MSYTGVSAVNAGQETLLQYSPAVQSAGIYDASPLFAEVLAAEMDNQMMRLALSGDDNENEAALFSTDISDLAVSNMLRQESSRTYELVPVSEEPAVQAAEQPAANVLTEAPVTVEYDGGMYVSKAYAGPSLQGVMYPASAYTVYHEDAYTEYTDPEPYLRSPEELRTARQLAADYALGREGDPYSQSKRGQGNYVDCSSLTQWAYRQAGLSIPSTAAEQARYCVKNDYIIPIADLQKGDLIFWERSDCSCGRFDEIHHVAVYLGDGQIVEASSSKGGVIQNTVWGEQREGVWKIAMCARPA